MRITRTVGDGVRVESTWVTGDVWAYPVTDAVQGERARVLNVRFAPRARTVWHRHPLGQVLIVTQGTGRVQRRGGPVSAIRAGDTVHIAPGEWHWHGAAPDDSMAHLAIEPVSDDGALSESGDAVTDDEYFAAGPAAEIVPPVVRSTVLDQILDEPQNTSRVEVRRITIAPGHPGGLHVHNGPVFGSIETGSVVYQIEGESASVLNAGDVFYEPKGVRISRFDARDDGVTFLGYFLLDADEKPEIEFIDE
jgi:quercetin dioxygenase-like cupin family protein